MPSDPTTRVYILGIGLDADSLYHWIIDGPIAHPDDVLHALQQDRTLGPLTDWAARYGWDHIQITPLAEVDLCWADACRDAIIAAAVREGHPLKNPSARQHRFYAWDQKPPDGHQHVCSLWEPGAEGPFHVGATHKSAKQWLHNIKFYSGRPSNTHRGYMQTVQHLLSRKKEPIAKVEATVPEKEARAKVRVIARQYGMDED
jgi:hypothetical protein